MNEIAASLKPAERARLTYLETIVGNGWEVFVTVGLALLEIKKYRLYREGYATWDDYCRERWDIQRAHADRLIEAAGVVKNLHGNDSHWEPQNERQARPLAALTEDQQRLAAALVERTAAINGVRPTAALVEAIAEVVSTALVTGTADGETPLDAAITEEVSERMQRQQQYIRERGKPRMYLLKAYPLSMDSLDALNATLPPHVRIDWSQVTGVVRLNVWCEAEGEES